MPQIDTYTAQTIPKVPDQPFRFMETGENPAAQIQRQGEVLGAGLSNIGGHIQAEQDSVDFGLVQSKYAAIPKEVAGKVALDPQVIQNPLLYEEKFNEELKKRQQELIESTTNKRITGAVQNLFDRSDPEIQLQAKAAGFKLAVDDNLAKLATSSNAKAKLSAEAISTGRPELATLYTRQYNQELKDAVMNRHMSKQDAQKDFEHHETKILETEMNIYARGGVESRAKLYKLADQGYFDGVDPTKRSIIMNIAFTADDAAERRTNQDALRRRHEDTERYFSNAFGKTLSLDAIEAIEAGQTNADPRIGPQLRAILEGRSVKERDIVVQHIAQYWSAAGPPTLERIEAERAMLTKHVAANGYSTDAKMQYQHLDALYQQQSNVMSAQATKATNQGLRLIEDELEATKPTPSNNENRRRRQKAVEDRLRAEGQLYIQDPNTDKSRKGIRQWMEQKRNKYEGPDANKDTRTPAQKSSDDFAKEDR